GGGVTASKPLVARVSAFTLSEVLITLGIIGVVATLTIPNLMQNTRNKELVSSYLKMHTTLSNAFKETEAVNGMYVKKMDEVTFKEYFESHLKKLSTCEDYDVCLTDGSKFNYGTYAEGCPTGTCMELTVDTNGNRMPNKSGKDIFTMLVTDRGIKALGESNMCETGLDCGAYILANHKLYDGTIDEVAPPEHEPTEPPVVEPELTPEEIAFNECKASGQPTCTSPDGTPLKKYGDDYVTEEQYTVNSLTDAYAMLNDIFDTNLASYFASNTPTDSTTLADLFKPYLDIEKDCATGSGCLPSSYNKLNGNEYSVDYNNGTDYYKFLLKDGSAIIFRKKYAASEGGFDNAIGAIFYDVDGMGGENTIGKDLFHFVLTPDGIKPGSSDSCNLSSHGYGCTNLVIQNGNMDYLDNLK
ncbi:type II secretion system protein, partial [bacterium]|nr:type II secretion system protein [bacterium]